MFSRKSLFTILMVALATASVAQTPPATTPAQPAVPATATAPAPAAATAPEGSVPSWIKAETPEQRKQRVGAEDPGPSPDATKVFFRYGKTYHIDRYDKRWARYDDVEEGWVRPFGFVNVTKEIYQQNDKYVWVWNEDKTPEQKAAEAEMPTNAPPRYSEAQLKYIKYMRPEFQDLPVAKSDRTVRFEEASEGLPTQGSWRNSLDVGDMNGDGFADLIVPPERGAGGAGSTPVIFLGDGKGHWKVWQEAQWEYGIQYGSAAVGDFNKDGHMDVAFGVHLNGVRVFLGDGKGRFADSSKGLPVDDFPTRRVRIADVDQDGWPDIIAISEGATAVPKPVSYGKMRVFFNRKNGTEWEGKDVADISKVFGGDWMAVGKFNADKYPDFAGASVYFQGSQILYRSKGKGIWDPVASDGTVVPYLSYYFAVDAARLRKATQLDDAILSYVRFWPSDVDPKLVADPPEKTVVGLDRVSFDGKEPKRTPIVRWAGSRGVWGLATADLDHDGNTDIIYTRYDPREFVILPGDGKGGFTRANIEGLSIEPNTNYDLKVADVNGDGLP
ncbi:MAG: VCBS repeat-containing protein, partial [Acidobacteriota bacterium]